MIRTQRNYRGILELTINAIASKLHNHFETAALVQRVRSQKLSNSKSAQPMIHDNQEDMNDS